jgi:hypothetical protein
MEGVEPPPPPDRGEGAAAAAAAGGGGGAVVSADLTETEPLPDFILENVNHDGAGVFKCKDCGKTLKLTPTPTTGGKRKRDQWAAATQQLKTHRESKDCKKAQSARSGREGGGGGKLLTGFFTRLAPGQRAAPVEPKGAGSSEVALQPLTSAASSTTEPGRPCRGYVPSSHPKPLAVHYPWYKDPSMAHLSGDP